MGGGAVRPKEGSRMVSLERWVRKPDGTPRQQKQRASVGLPFPLRSDRPDGFRRLHHEGGIGRGSGFTSGGGTGLGRGGAMGSGLKGGTRTKVPSLMI